MASLELRFSREPVLVLMRTTFRHRGRETIADRERDESSVQWRSGLQALIVVLLRWAAAARRPSAGGGIRAFEAKSGTASGSVKGYLSKELNWYRSVFGVDGSSVIRSLIAVRIRDSRSFLALNPEILTAHDIRVVVDGEPIEDAAGLDALAEEVELQRRRLTKDKLADPPSDPTCVPIPSPGPPVPVPAPAPVTPAAEVRAVETDRAPSPPPGSPPAVRRVAILRARGASPDEQLTAWLEAGLRARGHDVVVDRGAGADTAWARGVDQGLRGSDAAILLLSNAAERSEDLIEEATAVCAGRSATHCRPRLLSVCLDGGGVPPELAGLLGPARPFRWDGGEDVNRLVTELVDAMQRPPADPVAFPDTLPPDDAPVPGPIKAAGPVPFGGLLTEDECYVERPADEMFRAAVARRDSIILIQGPRQVGKTSLLARGVRHAREHLGARIALTDLQGLNQAQLRTPESLFRTLAAQLARQLGLPATARPEWDPDLGTNANFEDFLRNHVLPDGEPPLLWALDEVDRMFGCDFGGEIFALFRSWHNARSFDPGGPWTRLTLAISYATEAHLFIEDINQSPFNVGTPVVLGDFTPGQVETLNRCRSGPLRDGVARERFYRLVGGHPYLSNRGLYEMVERGWDVPEFEARAMADDGPFGNHLRRLLLTLTRDAALLDAARAVLRADVAPSPESFHRLRVAGVLAGEEPRHARLRCLLYRIYLEKHLL
jgi:hypothetical protein